MKSGQQEEAEEEDEVIVSKREDEKNRNKANAARSKHSVTEQRRRCRINERFQILRDLIPHSEQKRDTASFLLEVIEYVQYLQEKVQKYEGSYQGWRMEPTKLMPWRNSHWHVQSLVGPTQAVKNDSSPTSTFPGRFDENNITCSVAMHPISWNWTESDSSRDPSGQIDDQQSKLANKAIALPIPLHTNVSSSGPGDDIVPHPIHRPISDPQSTECPITSGALTEQEDLIVEGGSISLTSVYSQGLLNNLTQALQCAGVDLSQSTISVQIDLGKRANRRLTSGAVVSNTKVKTFHFIPRNPSSSRTAHQIAEYFIELLRRKTNLKCF
ncbi:transcription factor BIM2-like isoform X2 [Rhododendron vialii]|uniref:transcription factor BIM2-like isoform X2 n=1 Tax=Rhododendron vialii TaxID=182163 RepID=UPI00265DDA25|nr:transcription factor BIM2-like isoform X2 [Rhododendron vialii]